MITGKIDHQIKAVGQRVGFWLLAKAKIDISN
jgi:hypothetical protein